MGFELWQQISSWSFNLFATLLDNKYLIEKKCLFFFFFERKYLAKWQTMNLFLVHPLSSEVDKWLTFSNSSFVEHVLDFVIWIALLHVERLFCFCVFVLFYFFIFFFFGLCCFWFWFWVVFFFLICFWVFSLIKSLNNFRVEFSMHLLPRTRTSPSCSC